MQWLIDLIVEKIGVPPCYVDRGAPSVTGFQLGDTTIDDAWHTMDVSSVVPKGATAINCEIKCRCDTLARCISIRKDADGGLLHTCIGRVLNVNVIINFSSTISIASDRTFQYRISGGTFNVFDWRIRGWWL